MDEFIRDIKDLRQRVEKLESNVELRNVVLSSDGKLVLDKHTGSPTAETARITYDTTANKFIVCENGIWRTVSTT